MAGSFVPFSASHYWKLMCVCVGDFRKKQLTKNNEPVLCDLYVLCMAVYVCSRLFFRAVGTFARALDCSSSVRQPSLHMSAAAASRDITLVSWTHTHTHPAAPGCK